MAVIKIINIKENLEAVINYAQNGDKTENGILVSGINCVPQKAYKQMALAKKIFHKESGRLGYHIIQSFNGRELTPQEANEIGVSLAEELFGDKFQVIVCTHINKDNVHNHIVLNSVSFIDGQKYHNSNAEIALLKRKSDELCEDYGLSVIETSKAKKANQTYEKRIAKYNRSDEKMLLIKSDIDEAIQKVKRVNDFIQYLKSKGYVIYERGNYYTIKSPYFSRNIRLEHAFGEEYSRYAIQNRIYYGEKADKQKSSVSKKYFKKIYKGPKIDKLRLKFSPFYRYHVHLLYRLGKLPPKIEYQELTPEYFKKKKEALNIMEEFSFLARNDINSVDDLLKYDIWYSAKLETAKGIREDLYGKLHKATTLPEKNEIERQIRLKTYEINRTSEGSKVCRRFMWRRNLLQQEDVKNRKQQLAKMEFKPKNIVKDLAR